MAVTTICRMVHGMPLGIVLAASWLSMLSPAEIVTELQSGMDILEDEVGNLPDRQRSIRAVMNYSWQQMSPDERAVFMKLSVFRDGFTRSAAEKVTGAGLRVLMSLHNKALLRRDSNTGRYLIHELLRQYAEEHLEESGTAHEVKTNHAAYFADLIATQIPFLKGKGQIQAITLIESEISNLVTAWQFATNEKNTALIEKMLEGFNLYGLFRGWYKQTYEAFEYTRQAWDVYANADMLLNAKLIVRFPAIDRDPIPDLYKTLALAESQQQVFEVAYCKQQLGVLFSHHRGDMGGENTRRGITYLEEAIQIYRDLHELFYVALAQDDLAWSLATASRMEERIALLAQVVQLRRQIGDRVGLARGASGVASSLSISEEIIATLLEGLEISSEMQDSYNIAWLSAMLGMHYRCVSDLELAEKYCLSAIELGQRLNIEQVVRFAQANLFSAQVIQGHDPEDIETRLNSIFPDGIENYQHQPSVYFATLNTYIMIYTLLGEESKLKSSILNWTISGFGQKNLFWIVPNIAYWLAETDPDTSFVYFEYALKNEAYGSRWMRQSDTFMSRYRQLSQKYSKERTSDVWQRLQSLDFPTLMAELSARIK
jgi:tetratricopeptide (TPR) repeat protein